MAFATADQISSHEWTAVKDLLHDLQAEEDREQLSSLYGQWRLSIRAFRRVEARRMTAMQPTETDLLFHKACVTDLMSYGTLLQIFATERANEELGRHGVRRDVIEAVLRDLHNTFDEWHAQISQDRMDRLSAAIFDATPELNLSNPRA